jgi:hypothetical protein
MIYLVVCCQYQTPTMTTRGVATASLRGSMHGRVVVRGDGTGGHGQNERKGTHVAQGAGACAIGRLCYRALAGPPACRS